MKKVFIQIRQWILRHRKRLIYGALALCIGQICFFNLGGIGIESEVFAADSQTQDIEAKAKDKLQMVELVQKMIYILIYPMLVVAGNLADNSFVYGEVFKFDVILRELWNMMRNLANYTLGFIFVYKIFKYLIGGKKSEDIKKLLRGLLIAGIGIQASRFIMSALIDMSTILAYGIGGLPISILKDFNEENEKKEQQNNGDTNGDNGNGGTNKNTENTCGDNGSKYNPYILKTVIAVDVNNTSLVKMYQTNTNGENIYISECTTFNADKQHEVILGPSEVYYQKDNETFIATEHLKCHYNGQIYQFSGLYKDENLDLNSGWEETPTTSGDWKNLQDKYYATIVNIENILKTTDQNNTGNNSQSGNGGEQGDQNQEQEKEKQETIIGYIKQGILLEEGNAHVEGGIWGALRKGKYDGCDLGLDVDNVRVGTNEKSPTQRLNETLKEKSYVGVFTQLYSSLLYLGRNIIVKTDSVYGNLMSVALTLGFLIAIGIPLIVVGIMFIIRIGWLRLAIIISPFIAIMTAFEDDFGKKITDKIKFLENFKLENLIKIIFAPAIVCLAISLSAVLVTIIKNTGFSNYDSTQTILGGLIHLNVQSVTESVWKFFQAIIGAAITWYIAWAAIESSKLGESDFIKTLKQLAQSSMGSIPIVPIPGKDGKGVEFIGANTAFGLNGQRGLISNISDQIKSQYNEKENKAVSDWLKGGADKEDAKKNRTKAYIDRIKNIVPSVGSPWTGQKVVIGEKGNETPIDFNDRSIDQKKVIDAINNISSPGTRKAFGDSGVDKVTIGGTDYRFRETANDEKGDPENIYKYMSDEEYINYLKNHKLKQ